MALPKWAYHKVLEALSRTGPHPLPLLLDFLDSMKRAKHELTRQHLKELLLSQAARDDLEGTLSVVRVMMAEGLIVDADVVHCLMKNVSALPGDRSSAYVDAIDERIVQREERRERRQSLLIHVFHGLCHAKLSTLALHVLRLMHAREGCRVSAKHMEDLRSSLVTSQPSYIEKATQLISLMPSFSLTPTAAFFTSLTPDIKSQADVGVLLSTLSAMGLKGDAALYYHLLERLLALPVGGDAAMLERFDAVVTALERQALRLDQHELLQLHNTAKIKKLWSATRRLCTYIRALQLPVPPRVLLVQAQHATSRIKADPAWLGEVYVVLQDAIDKWSAAEAAKAPADASGKRSAAPVASAAATWSAVYEELLVGQARAPTSHSATWSVWWGHAREGQRGVDRGARSAVRRSARRRQVARRPRRHLCGPRADRPQAEGAAGQGGRQQGARRADPGDGRAAGPRVAAVLRQAGEGCGAAA